MKRTFGLIFTGACCVIAVMWCLILQFNQQLPVLEQGEVTSEPDASWGYRLGEWGGSDIGRQFSFSIGENELNYKLMIPYVRENSEVWCNGKRLQAEELGGIVFALPIEENTNQYELQLYRVSRMQTFLVEEQFLTKCLAFRENFNWATLAIMGVMALYTVSMFYYKRTETYLLDLFIYLVILIFWDLIRVYPGIKFMSWWTAFSRSFMWLIAVSSLKYCLSLAEIQLPGRATILMRWSFIPVWVLAVYWITYHFNPLRVALNIIFYILCVLVLSYALVKKIRGVVWPFVGMVMRTGLSPTIFFASLTQVASTESFLYYILRDVHFIELFFILGSMFFVNQKFAHQFSESERLAKHLDELVGERTRELGLAHAERQSMILNITHDLRTPLFVMKNCLDMVEENPQSLPDMLPVIQERSNFVNSLTEDLFLLVKLQEGKLMLNQQREDLAELLEELWVGMTVEAEKRGIRVAHRLIPQQYVWGDRVRLQQIFQNLVSNAFHYTPEGGQVSICMDVTDEAPEGVQIDAECVAVQEQLRWITVTVRDSGKGISPADAEHIFERYFYTKAENKHDSSGLGLSIAKELTLLHHGTIDFTSEEGRGTEFRVTLPLC